MEARVRALEVLVSKVVSTMDVMAAHIKDFGPVKNLNKKADDVQYCLEKLSILGQLFSDVKATTIYHGEKLQMMNERLSASVLVDKVLDAHEKSAKEVAILAAKVEMALSLCSTNKALCQELLVFQEEEALTNGIPALNSEGTALKRGGGHTPRAAVDLRHLVSAELVGVRESIYEALEENTKLRERVLAGAAGNGTSLEEMVMGVRDGVEANRNFIDAFRVELKSLREHLDGDDLPSQKGDFKRASEVQVADWRKMFHEAMEEKASVEVVEKKVDREEMKKTTDTLFHRLNKLRDYCVANVEDLHKSKADLTDMIEISREFDQVLGKLREEHSSTTSAGRISGSCLTCAKTRKMAGPATKAYRAASVEPEWLQQSVGFSRALSALSRGSEEHTLHGGNNEVFRGRNTVERPKTAMGTLPPVSPSRRPMSASPKR